MESGSVLEATFPTEVRFSNVPSPQLSPKSLPSISTSKLPFADSSTGLRFNDSADLSKDNSIPALPTSVNFVALRESLLSEGTKFYES